MRMVIFYWSTKVEVELILMKAIISLSDEVLSTSFTFIYYPIL